MNKKFIVQIIMHKIIKYFVEALLTLRVYDKSNLQDLLVIYKNRNCGIVFVSNHKSDLDPYIIFATLPHDIFVCCGEILFPIQKKMLCNSKFGRFYRLINCLPVADGKGGGVRQLINVIRNRKTVLYFPEGRIIESGRESNDQGLLQVITKYTDVIIQPIKIDGVGRFSENRIDILCGRYQVTVKFGIPKY